MKTGKIVIGIDRKVYCEPDNEKRLIEVSNEWVESCGYKEYIYIHIYDGMPLSGVKNNTPCKAEVTDKAKIIELIQ